jgi:putative FmdB family regulatory protein
MEVGFMPLYEYRCKSCGHTFEAIQKFSDRPLRKCSECSGPLEKLISRNSFQLKGGGWFSGDGCCGSGSCSH